MKHVTNAIKKLQSGAGFEFHGDWIRVRVSYMTRYITGKEFVDGKSVKTWKHAKMGGAVSYVKYR
ncbi:MAG: hypothetical protein ACI9MR_003195 [Myxococcota bacterium]|jgi:hypothetical protein